MKRRAMLLGLGCLAGCLGRALPVPPPGFSPPEVSNCPQEQCPNGGVVVSMRGTATPGALVIAEDTNPGTMGTNGELLATAARVTERGDWRLVLGPQRDPSTGGVRAVQRGDVLSLYQVVSGTEDGVSAPVMVRIP